MSHLQCQGNLKISIERWPVLCCVVVGLVSSGCWGLVALVPSLARLGAGLSIGLEHVEGLVVLMDVEEGIGVVAAPPRWSHEGLGASPTGLLGNLHRASIGC